MCYSAKIQSDYKKFVSRHGATMDIKEFAKLWLQQAPLAKRVRLPRAAEDWFKDLDDPAAEPVWAAIVASRAEREAELQQELFKQAKRLADAKRKLQTKITKKAQEDQRIATGLVAKIKSRLDDLNGAAPSKRGARFYPGEYAPVIVENAGCRVVKPMRFRLRPPGWTEAVEKKFPGTFNARRDNLGSTWRALFGRQHGIIVATAFYESVDRHDMEQRPLAEGEAVESVELEFRPEPVQDMVLACLWNESHHAGSTLLSFAAITDDPVPEVAATGHDRTVIQIKPENVDRWLTPQGRSIEELQAILDDRPAAFYRHRVALAA